MRDRTGHSGGAFGSSTPHDQPDGTIDINTAHTSRIYDYLLGGTNHFAVDREVAQHAFATWPGGVDGARADARANRAFLGRVVSHLAGEAGIRQFLDIGTGIPNEDNVHAVAQQTVSSCRIVYVDNDPIVLAHSHAMLRSHPRGATAYVHADLREPDVILKKAATTLDLLQPIGLVLIGLLHVIPDEDDPYGCVSQLVDAVAPGSYLAISHVTNEVEPDGMSKVEERLDRTMRASNPPAFRSQAELARFFEGLELIEPGIVPVNSWRPDDGLPPPSQHPARRCPVYGGVARKPLP
ncbi:MAG TPA: SAM-dependent methyltransferase [Acidimicrobiales bacterium]